MNETATRNQILLARLALGALVALALCGAAWYGFSADVRDRVWRSLLNRPGGPMTFRFILQPIMAAIAAARDGMKDARLGSSPYLWSILTDPGHSRERLYEGLISTARIIILGLVMDTVYQIIQFKAFFPGEAVVIAILLAFVPYLLLRGPFARIARMWRGDNAANKIR